MVDEIRKSFWVWLAERAQERTTAAGVAATLAAAGFHIAPDLVQTFLPLIGGGLILLNSTR